MQVVIKDKTGYPLRLCENCGKDYARRHKAEWPLPHQTGRTSWIGGNRRDKVTILLDRDADEPDCAWCDERPEREKGEDDGLEYADPRDAREERLFDW